MSKLFNVFTAILLIVGSCFVVSDSQAKVCFLGEDCGSGGNFSDTSGIKPDEMCIAEGYTLKSDCLATPNKQIAGYCPYSSKYVTCCGLEYAYSKCSYPLVSDGVCGNKHKCICDSGEYPYYQKSATVCSKITGTPEYLNSYASGGSCAYADYSSGSLKSKIQFSQCSCDRGLYPKSEEECSTINAGTTGASCTDSEGNTYYAACLCGEEFRVITADCEYGTYSGEPLCQQGDVYKAKRCCTCPDGTYPYDSTNLPDYVLSTTSCETVSGCTRGGSKVKATSCKKGWEVKNGECVPVSCSDAVKIFLEKNTGYGLLTPDGLVDSKGNLITSGTKTAIVADDISVKQGKNDVTVTWTCNKCSSGTCYVYGQSSYPPSNNSKWDGYSRASSCNCADMYCDKQTYDPYPNYGQTVNSNCGKCRDFNSCYCDMGTFYCTHISTKEADCTKNTKTNSYKGIAGAPANDYYSVPYLLAKNNWSDTSEGVAALKRSCTKNPTLTFSTSGTFPVDERDSNVSTTTLRMYGINFDAWSSTWFRRPIEIYNGNFEGSHIYTEGNFKIERVSSMPNGEKGLKFDVTGLTINKGFRAKGYDFNIYPTSDLFGIEVNNVKKYSSAFSDTYVGNDYNGPGDNVVEIAGISSSDKIKVNVGRLYVRGIMSFKYADVYSKETVVGALYKSCTNSIYGAFLTLYNSNLYLYDTTNSSTRKLINCANSGVGYPSTSASHTLLSTQGSNIVTQKTTYYGIRYSNRAHKSNGSKFIKFINGSGTITTNTNYHFYTSETSCSFWGCDKGHTYRPTNSTIDGYGNTSVANCQKNGDDGCYKASYDAR